MGEKAGIFLAELSYGEVINLLFKVDDVKEGEKSRSFLLRAEFGFAFEVCEAWVRLFSRVYEFWVRLKSGFCCRPDFYAKILSLFLSLP